METELLRLSYSLDTIDTAVRSFWKTAGRYRVFAFSGDMGAGKTTFIHHLCDHLKVHDVVSSPTFALINEYHFAGTGGTDNMIFHMDWYRLRNSEEAFNAGMEDCVDQARTGNAFCLIEWPEKAKELLHAPYLWVSINVTSPTERDMSLTLIS
ncbi:MAG: tsaE [Flavipsychrobacter sp.]|nr:tsaE [Flavipsychrobacter sp.]